MFCFVSRRRYFRLLLKYRNALKIIQALALENRILKKSHTPEAKG